MNINAVSMPIDTARMMETVEKSTELLNNTLKNAVDQSMKLENKMVQHNVICKLQGIGGNVDVRS